MIEQEEQLAVLKMCSPGSRVYCNGAYWMMMDTDSHVSLYGLWINLSDASMKHYAGMTSEAEMILLEYVDTDGDHWRILKHRGGQYEASRLDDDDASVIAHVGMTRVACLLEVENNCG